MMRKGILRVVVCLTLVVGMVACGGGGGGEDATTPVGTAVNLSQIKNFAEARTPGSSMSFNLAGSSSAGANLTGTYSCAISTPTIALTPAGTQTVNVFVQNVTLTNTSTGAFVSGMSTYYYYQSGYLYKIEYSDGMTSNPTSQTLLPLSARVGDFGADMTLSNSDGTTETSTWRIDPGTNGDAKFVYIYTERDSLNQVTYTSEDSYTIKPDGSIAAMSTKYYEPSAGITMTLSGNRN